MLQTKQEHCKQQQSLTIRLCCQTVFLLSLSVSHSLYRSNTSFKFLDGIDSSSINLSPSLYLSIHLSCLSLPPSIPVFHGKSRCCQNILLYFDESSQWPAVYKRPDKVRHILTDFVFVCVWKYWVYWQTACVRVNKQRARAWMCALCISRKYED